MDRLLQFSDYDIFGYLSTGLAGLALCDVLLGTNFVVGAQWSVSDTVLVVASSYIAGHLLAAMAQVVLERWLVFRVLGRPASNLLGHRPTTGLKGALGRTILADFYEPLSAPLLSRVTRATGTNDGEEAFQLAYPTTLGEALVRGKIETFQRLYGFCRNVSFVAAIGTVALGLKFVIVTAGSGWNVGLPTAAMAGGCAVVAIGLFLRYLKFLRRFAVTVLTSPLTEPTKHLENKA